MLTIPRFALTSVQYYSSIRRPNYCIYLGGEGGLQPLLNYGGGGLVHLQNFCSYGGYGEPRDFLIEQSYVSFISAAV